VEAASIEFLVVAMRIAMIVLECIEASPEADKELEQLKARLGRLRYWRLDHSAVIQTSEDGKGRSP